MLEALLVSNLVFLALTVIAVEFTSKEEVNMCEESAVVRVISRIWELYKEEKLLTSKYVYAIMLITAMAVAGIGMFFGEKAYCLLKKFVRKASA